MLDKYDAKETERRLIDFWEREGINAFDPNSKREVYSIDTPPATVSGNLSVGHLMSYTQMDFMARYRRMRGYNLFYPMGMDSNGLPTENFVEQKYGTTPQKLGSQKFLELVRKTVEEYQEEYKGIWRSIALSVDWSLLYDTMGSDERKTSQLSFIELYNQGRAYRKETPTLWCPVHKTAVSQIELDDVPEKTTLVYIRFSDDVTVATTRPELLPACVAIFVSPEDKEHAKLVGKTVNVPLFEYSVKVIADPRVDTKFGTGMVMCCTFGDQTDIEWYKAYNLELKLVMDDSGTMTYGRYAGMKPAEARKQIVEELRKEGRIVKEEQIEHNIKVHERGKHAIEFMVKKQWYVRVLDLKSELIRLGNELKWHPAFMHVRYDNWVDGLQWDWCISRQRFFGIRFPVWYCKKCGAVKLADVKQLPVDPGEDKPVGKCDSCGSTEFVAETDIMDTWATSSLTPLILARWAGDRKYMPAIYPMSLRPQGNDIISFWLFTTIVKCYLHTKKLPWSDAFISGYGLDSKGRPMHKSLGNVIEAKKAIEQYGADAIRYWAASANLGEDLLFQEKELVSAQRLANKLWNVAKFVEKAGVGKREGRERAIDSWMRCRATLAVKSATDCFEDFNYAGARRSAEDLFRLFSDDYLEFVKHRVYGADKSANATLSEVFLTVLKLFAPFMPFVTDEIYTKLFFGRLEKGVSVHVSDWPDYDAKLLDAKNEKLGDDAEKVIAQIRRWKHDNRLALNSELNEVVLSSSLGEFEDDIKGAMKIKSVSVGAASTQVQGSDIRIEIVK